MSKFNSYTRYLSLAGLILTSSCATYAPQLKHNQAAKRPNAGIAHTFYIAGGAGNMNNEANNKVLDLLKSQLEEANENSTLIFTGDNITEDENDWNKDKLLLDQQLDLARNFKGETLFIPGNNEWKSYDTNKIEEVEKYIDSLEKENIKFYPKNVCPIEHKVINDKLDLILIDSKWFISNWSRITDMNKKCTDIITRRRFIEVLEGYINDGQGKNIVIAMHHPIFSNGRYAGKESFKSHMNPIPIVGSLVNGIKDLGAFSPDRLNSRRYNYLRILVSALAKASDRITVVSGHEESLQYLTGGDIHQVISGSLSRKTPTRRSKDRITTIGGSLDYKGIFTEGEIGFAKLDYFEDGSSQVTFISEAGIQNTLDVLPETKSKSLQKEFPEPSDATKTDAVLDNKETLDKSGFYKFLWGDRYRSYFGKSVTAPVALLDTLYGGLKVTKKGGGHQSYSIRLENKNGKEYAMRSLRKNALKFLKFKIKGIAYTNDEYNGTLPEKIVTDFFTTAHPYMQLVINPLAQAVNVNHSSPVLFYIPKQQALGDLNDEFGNELYFIEERPSEEQLNFKGYRRAIDEAGEIKDFESTTDMLEKIKSDESYFVSERDLIRARIFDMLIGDWDRHQDQWRWVEYETQEDGDKLFLPVPRDRDNAFPRFDGAAIKLIKLFVPNSRRFQSYDAEIEDVKWLNIGGNRLDRVLLTKYDARIWEEEARFIQENLTKAKIDAAFLRLPKEVRDQTSDLLKKHLEDRLTKLPEHAKQYSAYLDKIVSLHGTEKDDLIEITRMPQGKTKVVIKRLLSDETNELIYERTFERNKTRELWIYGLGDADKFIVTGEGKEKTFIRLIGGYGDDQYTIANSKSLKVYEWEHEKLNFTDKKPAVHHSDLYETNTFHWRFFEENSNVLVPNVGFRTDDGIYLGATNTYTYNGFNGNPFRQQHSLAANYYFRFKAFELSYKGIFANIYPKWNFEMDGYYTSDRFSNNFFGTGNETVNMEDQLGRDFYRARMQQLKFEAGVAYYSLRLKALYESFKVREIQDRFFVPTNLNEDVFESQHYVGGEAFAYYKSDDAADFPSKAIYIGLTAGYKTNTNMNDNNFGYLAFKAGFNHKLITSGDLVFGTTAEVKTNFGDNYFFYHTPSLGGDNGLRGFRDERFSGKMYFYQSSDLRLRIARFVTVVAPITVGIYGGFDYGRVWERNDPSDVWHTSQGGGLWISGFNFLAFNAGYFNSVEGNIIQVGLGFDF